MLEERGREGKTKGRRRRKMERERTETEMRLSQFSFLLEDSCLKSFFRCAFFKFFFFLGEVGQNCNLGRHWGGNTCPGLDHQTGGRVWPCIPIDDAGHY